MYEALLALDLNTPRG